MARMVKTAQRDRLALNLQFRGRLVSLAQVGRPVQLVLLAQAGKHLRDLLDRLAQRGNLLLDLPEQLAFQAQDPLELDIRELLEQQESRGRRGLLQTS